MANSKRRDRIATTMMVAIYREYKPNPIAKAQMRENPTGFRRALAQDAVAYADALIAALDAQSVGATPLVQDEPEHGR